MSQGSNTVSVTILDKEYQVACPPEQQAELLLSARLLDEQMRAIRTRGKVIGLERIAVMAALNISHELIQTRNGAAADTGSGKGAKAGKPGKPGKPGSGKVSNPAAKGDDQSADGAALAGLNAKLDEALQQLRQLEIGS